MVEATPHARTQQPMRTPGSQGSSRSDGQPLWTITAWPVTPHVDSSVPMVNGPPVIGGGPSFVVKLNFFVARGWRTGAVATVERAHKWS